MASNYLAKGLKRSALTVALGLCFAGGVQAQSTTGNINGTVAAGSTVTISNSSGLTRTATADANGRYTFTNLPVGTYTVNAGADKRQVVVTVGSTANVSFGENGPTNLDVVTVLGSNVPQIDVSSTDTRSIVTAEELTRIPLQRTAEAIALMAPGTTGGNGTFFGNQISFGGSSVAENAYYLNGFFSGNPMTNIGGYTLPYGSIEQQETYTGGYGAKYGRSAGGVISQVGKSGTNEWKFGGQVIFTPKSMKETRPDRYQPNDTLPAGYAYTDPDQAGLQFDRGEGRLTWGNTYSAYIGGPILKDKLFFFLSAETSRNKQEIPGGNPEVGFAQTGSKFESDDPKVYAKINWNITDNHLLEATYVAEKFEQTGKKYAFDYDTYQFGNYLIPDTKTRDNTEFAILKYTGYLTDNLTLSGTYGRSRNRYDTDPYLTGLPQLTSAGSQNPALNGGNPITNVQGTYRATNETSDYTTGLRLELEWLLGNHALTVGMDNTTLEGVNEGTSQLGQNWVYGKAARGNSNISSSLGVGPTGTGAGACNGAANATQSNCGYYVYDLKFFDTTSMRNKQNAFYLEDKWRISDNLLLSLGVRADTYQNFSDTGRKFVDSGTQWQPRVGFAWDVNGDSSFKVFGNAGRYFLNMPNAVAIRGVGASTFTRQYYTYTGIDANGAPTGLTPVGGVNGTPPPGPVSSNGEIGTPKDPESYVPNDIKSQYQDEFALGFEHSLGDHWTLGTKLTSRVLKSAIDDVCDFNRMPHAAGMSGPGAFAPNLAGFVMTDTDGKTYLESICYMFNPGGGNTYSFPEVTRNATTGLWQIAASGARKTVKIPSSALGMDYLKRNYTALDFFLERAWDGKWGARIDYTYSKSRGNSEGPANSDTGQGSNPHDNGVATSQNFDAAEIMAFADGYLANDRRHQLKAHGAYSITDEWMVSGNLRIASGAPISCFGWFNPDGRDETSEEADPIGYGGSYHTCFGEAWNPGKKFGPWTHRIDLGLTYKPAFLDHKLAVNVNVFNVFNKTTATSFDQNSEDDPYVVSNTYNMPLSFSTPRSVQFSVTYDF